MSDETDSSQSPEGPAQTRDPEYDLDKVIAGIRAADGNLTQAAKNIGCSRKTLTRYCREFDRVAEARDEGRKTLVDLARSTYREVLEDPHADHSDRLKAANQVTKKYDTTTEPERQKHEHSGEGGGPIMVIDSGDSDG